MKIFKYFLTIIVLFNFLPLYSVEKDEQIKNKILKNIRCLVCQGQSVYDSQSDFALSMKLVVKKKLDEGLSENEIYEFLIEKYGQWIAYDPEFNQKTFILWTLPILLFLVGGVILLKKIKLLK